MSPSRNVCPNHIGFPSRAPSSPCPRGIIPPARARSSEDAIEKRGSCDVGRCLLIRKAQSCPWRPSPDVDGLPANSPRRERLLTILRTRLQRCGDRLRRYLERDPPILRTPGHHPKMIPHSPKLLVAWNDLEDSPSFWTIKDLSPPTSNPGTKRLGALRLSSISSGLQRTRNTGAGDLRKRESSCLARRVPAGGNAWPLCRPSSSATRIGDGPFLNQRS
jgi:hypothetical protein